MDINTEISDYDENLSSAYRGLNKPISEKFMIPSKEEIDEIYKEVEKNERKAKKYKNIAFSLALSMVTIFGGSAYTLHSVHKNSLSIEDVYRKAREGDINSVVKRYNRVKDAGSWDLFWAGNPEIDHLRVLDGLEARIIEAKLENNEKDVMKDFINNFEKYSKTSEFTPEIEIRLNELKIKLEK